MFFQFVLHTPAWVWVLLVALIGLGLSQTVNRHASLKRVIATPVALTIYSIYGMVNTFGSKLLVLLAWAMAAIITLSLWLKWMPAGKTSFDHHTQTIAIAGSWVPLGLILGIFITKYVVGIEAAINPALSKDMAFAITVSALLGMFSGSFLGRAIQVTQWVRKAKASRSSEESKGSGPPTCLKTSFKVYY